MYGLAVRWSLVGSRPEVAASLRDYVQNTSLDKFTGMPGLRFKTWRMVPGEWFEGTYVFATREGRDEFAARFEQTAPTAPVTQMIGTPPQLQQPFDVLAVAEGAAGFLSGPGPK